MSVVVHSFPSFHGFNTRGAFFLAIVALHVLFFWAMSSGLTHEVLERTGLSQVFEVPIERERNPEPPVPSVDVKPDFDVPRVPVPVIDVAPSITDDFEVPPMKDGPSVISDGPGSGPIVSEPVTTMPRIDPSRPLAEPVYPPQEIRMNRAGSVLLALQVLPDGSIGDVRVERSSGRPRLDEAAVRAARTWKLVPGTRDGVPVAMWKQVPVTFQLK